MNGNLDTDSNKNSTLHFIHKEHRRDTKDSEREDKLRLAFVFAHKKAIGTH
jgi:hypothetical protein